MISNLVLWSNFQIPNSKNVIDSKLFDWKNCNQTKKLDFELFLKRYNVDNCQMYIKFNWQMFTLAASIKFILVIQTRIKYSIIFRIDSYAEMNQFDTNRMCCRLLLAHSVWLIEISWLDWLWNYYFELRLKVTWKKNFIFWAVSKSLKLFDNFFFRNIFSTLSIFFYGFHGFVISSNAAIAFSPRKIVILLGK